MAELGKEITKDQHQFNEELSGGALGDLMAELSKSFTQDTHTQFNEELSKLLQTTVPPGGRCETQGIGGEGGCSDPRGGYSDLVWAEVCG